MAVRYRCVPEEQVGAQRRGYVERSCALDEACMRRRMLHWVSCRGALVLHQLHSSELKKEKKDIQVYLDTDLYTPGGAAAQKQGMR